jgi:hypothetical protein
LGQDLAQHRLRLLVNRKTQPQFYPVFGPIGPTPLEDETRSLRAHGVHLDIRNR